MKKSFLFTDANTGEMLNVTVYNGKFHPSEVMTQVLHASVKLASDKSLSTCSCIAKILPDAMLMVNAPALQSSSCFW